MRILFSSYHNPNFTTITEYIEKAVEISGNELIVFDDREHIIPGRIRKRISWLNELDLQYINKQFVSLVLAKKPDIAIIGGGDRINLHSIKTLNDHSVKTVLWTTDPPRNFKKKLETGTAYKYIFCQGSEAIELFDQVKIKNVHWLPMACDPNIHHPVELSPKEQHKFGNDIVFVGSYYPSRYKLFKKLSDFDFGIWGPGWNKIRKTSDLRSHIKGEHTRPSEWAKIYSASKIILAPHYQDPQNRYPVYQASPRIFEAMACGALVISDYQKDVFELFKDGEHLLGFKNIDELIEKIRYYLFHPDERKMIAKCGREEVLKNHKYFDRIEKMVSIVCRDQNGQ